MHIVSVDWIAIKDDYISSTLTYRQLSEKYGVKLGTLSKVASKEGWHIAKGRMKSSKESRKERILKISDDLLDKIEKSILEIDRCIIKTKEKSKTVEYDSDLKKPINEVVEEKENIHIIEGMIDKMGLKQLVSTLKDIKDIHMSIEEGVTDDTDDRGIIVLSDVEETDGDDNDGYNYLDAAE